MCNKQSVSSLCTTPPYGTSTNLNQMAPMGTNGITFFGT